MRYSSLMFIVLLTLLWPGRGHAASSTTVEIQSIQISPSEVAAGKRPDIIGMVKAESAAAWVEALEINVTATLTRPDNSVKSWTWKKISIMPGDTKYFPVEKDYDTGIKGVYKVEFSVYSRDMRPLKKLARTFAVADPSQPSAKPSSKAPAAAGSAAPAAKAATKREATEQYLGMGAYVNAVNTAGGITLLSWPTKNIGLQASYTMGNFTTAEGRLLLRYPVASGFNPYAGLGFANVSTERTVDTINIKTTFSDTGPTAALGIEIPLGRNLMGYAEVSGTSVSLKKEVSSGGVSGTAEVKYAPVTIGFSIVYFAF